MADVNWSQLSPGQLHNCVVRSRRKKRCSVEGARPWLEDARVPYQFLWETGDLSQVVNRVVAEQNFQEVVVVSRHAPPSSRFLGPLMGRSPYLDRLQTQYRTRLSVITANRGPGRRS